MYDPTGDVLLVLAAKQGDRATFATLYERHRPRLVMLCRRTLNDTLLAEDAAQEAALQAFLSLERLQHPPLFGPWLCGIGLNICRRWLRQRRARWWSWEALLGGSPMQELPHVQTTPEEEVERTDLVERVRLAVAALPLGQRAAVMLFYLDGLSYPDVAALLGINVSAVKTRLYKARLNLREKLWVVWQEETMTHEAGTSLVDMRVADVYRLPAQGDKSPRNVVMLEEVSGTRRFPIWVGQWEADALAITMEQVSLPRPLTYTFTARLLDAAGARLQEVQINRLSENTYFAEAIIAGPVGEQRVDARPSDALNLAMLMNAPIRVAPVLIEEAVGRITTYEGLRETARAGGVPEDELPSEESFRQVQQVVSGERTGGTAAIVAEIMANRHP